MRVLVLRALGLGDLLTAVPALRALRAAHPTARLELVAPAPLAALLGDLVDEVHDVSWVRGVPDSARLDVARPDLAVNLHGRGPQSTAALEALHPGRLVAYGRTSTWHDDEHEVHRWCRLLEEAGVPADPAALDLDPPAEEPLVRDAVVVHPGAALPSRRWPVERWAEVVRRLPGPVVVTGGPDEVGLALEVAEGRPGVTVLAGRTTPVQLAAVVAAARLLVAPDTGVAHLATALGTPSVVLFGPTPPALWGPPPDRPRHRVLWAGRAGDNASAAPDPGLLEIWPDDVVRAAADLVPSDG
jgi:ADP-heptose:LPS heptosyltransferase